ncbi:FeoB-associated Cys-rich membrane protein [Flavobacteriaceae bacterium XHP0103]|nr:FeoB-associated Cys-rich membrane protein [Marixanthotalea marina]MBU3820781.1 FeoB-associated Cys-rich membrane protein [Marixanthotalea marina]
MNTVIQNILVISAMVIAVGYLVKKFFWKKPVSEKGCGSGDNCGCH